MRAVDTYTCCGEAKEGLLLRVSEGEAFESAKDDRIWRGGSTGDSHGQEDSNARYAITMESRRAIASSATALVRSIVNKAEFFCRRRGSNGASSSTGHKCQGMLKL